LNSIELNTIEQSSRQTTLLQTPLTGQPSTGDRQRHQRARLKHDCCKTLNSTTELMAQTSNHLQTGTDHPTHPLRCNRRLAQTPHGANNPNEQPSSNGYRPPNTSITDATEDLLKLPTEEICETRTRQIVESDPNLHDDTQHEALHSSLHNSIQKEHK
jgi:hypothetical protein